MPDRRYLALCCLTLLTAACGELKCPAGYMKYGDQCRRCPPGEERERGRCVPVWDASVEPVDEDVSEDAAIPSVLDDAMDTPSATLCYVDEDGDGAGAGEPVDCDQTGARELSGTEADCDDSDPARAPNLTDVCGDNIDNDCDGTPDNEANNACGGPCGAQLGHQPGDVCDNGLKGACFRASGYECEGAMKTRCGAPIIAASSEACGDNIDNDCDGEVDESDSVDAVVWYEDCDEDGYSGVPEALIAMGVGIRRACTKPSARPSCGGGWTDRRPIAGSTRDCDDSSKAYRPGMSFGLPPAGRTQTDLNCDGIDEPENALAIPNPLNSEWPQIVYELCDSALSCTACAGPTSEPRMAGQWLSGSGGATNTKPRCSTSERDTYPARVTFGFGLLDTQSCPGNEWAWSGSDSALQRCR